MGSVRLIVYIHPSAMVQKIRELGYAHNRLYADIDVKVPVIEIIQNMYMKKSRHISSFRPRAASQSTPRCPSHGRN